MIGCACGYFECTCSIGAAREASRIGKLLQAMPNLPNEAKALAKELNPPPPRFALDFQAVQTSCHYCGAPAVLRKNSRTGEKFYGCSRWQECKADYERAMADAGAYDDMPDWF